MTTKTMSAAEAERRVRERYPRATCARWVADWYLKPHPPFRVKAGVYYSTPDLGSGPTRAAAWRDAAARLNSEMAG